jgi:hypothetical protein
VAGTILTAPGAAECLQPPVQVKEVTVLACESPAPYIRMGTSRTQSYDLEFLKLSREEFAEQLIDRARGAVLVLRVSKEITIESHIANDGERYWQQVTEISPWTNVERTERIWWRFEVEHTCDDFPRLQDMRVFVTPPCCDTIPETDVPCVADLDVGIPVPDWASEAIDKTSAPDR